MTCHKGSPYTAPFQGKLLLQHAVLYASFIIKKHFTQKLLFADKLLESTLLKIEVHCRYFSVNFINFLARHFQRILLDDCLS